jgi:hypothetical protein
MDFPALMEALKSAEKHSTLWWYLQTAVVRNENGSYSIDLSQGRSSHTWRSLVCTCAELGRYVNQPTYLKSVDIIDEGCPDMVETRTILILPKPDKPNLLPDPLHSRGMLTIRWRTAVQINNRLKEAHKPLKAVIARIPATEYSS